MSKQELNIKETVVFVKDAYAETLMPSNTKVFTHCWSSAKLAEQIAQKLFGEIRNDLLPQDVPDIIAAIVHAALLQEAISVGRKTFENVADVANVQIASMVSTLSRDYRLVETKRDVEYRGRLSQSPVSTQIVAVATMVCTAQELVNFLKSSDKHSPANLVKARKILAQIDADLLVIHAAARYYALRLYVHAARNLLSDANQLIKNLKASARQLKQTEKLAANIASRVAAKATIVTEVITIKED